MDDSMYPLPDAGIAARRKELAPAPLAAFKAFSEAAFAEGALSANTTS